jgi:hypothetical protein
MKKRKIRMAYWVIPEKIHTPHARKKFPPYGGETKLFLIIANVLGHPKGEGEG